MPVTIELFIFFNGVQKTRENVKWVDLGRDAYVRYVLGWVFQKSEEGKREQARICPIKRVVVSCDSTLLHTAVVVVVATSETQWLRVCLQFNALSL